MSTIIYFFFPSSQLYFFTSQEKKSQNWKAHWIIFTFHNRSSFDYTGDNPLERRKKKVSVQVRFATNWNHLQVFFFYKFFFFSFSFLDNDGCGGGRSKRKLFVKSNSVFPTSHTHTLSHPIFPSWNFHFFFEVEKKWEEEEEDGGGGGSYMNWIFDKFSSTFSWRDVCVSFYKIERERATRESILLWIFQFDIMLSFSSISSYTYDYVHQAYIVCMDANKIKFIFMTRH